MYTINTTIAENEENSIKVLNTSSLHDTMYGVNKSLFSPSINIDVLTPPPSSFYNGSPVLYEKSCDISRERKIDHVKVIRDCYANQIFNTLQNNACKSLDILTTNSSNISRDDIEELVVNSISSCEICDKTNVTIKKYFKDQLINNLSNRVIYNTSN